jgi:hypothetical protein
MSLSVQRIAAGLALTTALCAPEMVAAQQPQSENPSPNITVQQRPRPDYDPLGIRAGSFLIFPSITLSGEFNDNAFATKNNTDSDFGAILSPQVNVNSNWSRHALNFAAGATGAAWANYDQNDYLDAFASATGRLDIRRDDIVSGTLRFDRLHDARDNPDSPGAGTNERPEGNLTRYYQSLADTQYRHNFNRIYTVIGGGVQRLNYIDNGQSSTESRRDRTEYGARARVGYKISPRIGTFLQGNYSYRDYDESEVLASGQDLDRTNSGYRISLGTDVDITGLVFGEMALSYSERNYDSSQFKDSNGFGGNGSLTWNVTPLTTIIFNAGSEIKETTVEVNGEPASGDFENTVGIDVTHELLRNVLLNANAAYIRDDFQGVSRTDNIFNAGLGASYLLNRNWSLNATYDFTTRNSDSSGDEFTRNTILVGLTAKL